ncbi:MAG: metallophosphoesterase [Deltaproteobacteria bacterium]|nr:MAG: metallophosphoesterase [Deltaproteobacteria bacterium]
MPSLIQTLPDGPLDILGDVHGEIDALRRLLERLGCDPERGRATRPLVFVGDLVDRGPDSPAVLDLVRRLVDSGIAWVVAGNHELNLLLGDRKEGNGWFFGDASDSWQRRHDDGTTSDIPFDSALLPAARQGEVLRFLRRLPLVLERADLRIVHAAWHTPSLEAVREVTDLAAASKAHDAKLHAEWRESGLLARAREERAAFAQLRRRDVEPDRDLPNHALLEEARQSRHPIKVLTSGLERRIPFEDRFFVGGRWRLVERVRWWEDYRDEPAVVMGHYWRSRDGGQTGKPDFFDAPPFAWLGPRGKAFCIDYSVGRRYHERVEHPAGGAPYRHGLGALRWPERVVFFDDRAEPVPTTNFGQRG